MLPYQQAALRMKQMMAGGLTMLPAEPPPTMSSTRLRSSASDMLLSAQLAHTCLICM